MLKFEKLTVRYGMQTVIDSLTFEFPEGAIIAITGTSGIGKTTLLNVIAGFLKPNGGLIHSNYHSPSYIFQDSRLFPWMTALENVSTVCKNPTLAEQLLHHLLPNADDAAKYPDELSGGMKQRVAIARALAYDYDLLLMDEPFKGLDPETRNQVSKFVFEHAKGKTVLIVTHDQTDLSYCDVILRLDGAPANRLILEKSNNPPD